MYITKCKIMHIGFKNPKASYSLDCTAINATKEERDLGIIISDDLKCVRQCSSAVSGASQILGCIGKGINSRDRKDVMTLCRSLVRPHLEYLVQFWRPYLQKDIHKLETKI